MHGQGATEYLVLLAVVLIISLVAIALLGFFPGMAGDAKITESQAYWKGATPLAIVDVSGIKSCSVETGARYFNMKIQNTGSYRIRLSKIWLGRENISLYNDVSAGTEKPLANIEMGPGEETCIGGAGTGGEGSDTFCVMHQITLMGPATGQTHSIEYELYASQELCDANGKGTAELKDFGFEYVQIIDGTEITKKEIGKGNLILKCDGMDDAC